MTERIEVDFAMVEGAMLRVLGLVERRGFEVRGVAMKDEGEQGSLRLDVRPRDASRRLEILAGHLRRLVDVRHVTVSTRDFQS